MLHSENSESAIITFRVVIIVAAAIVKTKGLPWTKKKAIKRNKGLSWTWQLPQYLNLVFFSFPFPPQPPMEPHNHSSLAEFVLLGFPKVGHVRGWLFALLLLAYVFTMCGTLLIFLVIRLDAALHTPTYQFVSVVSFLELCYTAPTLQKI